MNKYILILFILGYTYSIAYTQSPATTLNQELVLDCDEICEIEKVIQEGTLLGVEITNYQYQKGAIVLNVLDHTAASKYSFQKLDVILQVNDTLITGMAHLVNTIQSYKPSNVVNIKYLRGDETKNINVILGAKKTTRVIEKICCEDEYQYFNSANITLYPNPSVNNINLEMKEGNPGNYAIQIFNINGERVYNNVSYNNNGFEKNIDINKFSAGEYYLNISKGDASFTQTFIKLD